MSKFDHRRLKLAEAQAFVQAHHRHCDPLKRHRWSTGVYLAGRPYELLGVATANTCSSHLWSRRTDHIEIARLCTNGYPNAGSFLLGVMVKACFAVGYRTIITYTQPHESGSTLRACGFYIQRRHKMTLQTDGHIRGGLVQWCRSRSLPADDEDRAFTAHVLESTHATLREWHARPHVPDEFQEVYHRRGDRRS